MYKLSETKLSKLYEVYTRISGNRNIFDNEISILMKKGLSRKEAIKTLLRKI